MQELDPCIKLAFLKPEGSRRLGITKVRWLETVEGELKKMGVRNWWRKEQDREQWRAILEEAEVRRGL